MVVLRRRELPTSIALLCSETAVFHPVMAQIPYLQPFIDRNVAPQRCGIPVAGTSSARQSSRKERDLSTVRAQRFHLDIHST